MTPEVAIAIFDKMLKRYAWAEDNKSVQAIKVAKECIEKQIAKKPKTFTLPYSNQITANFCPVCNNDEIDHEYKKTHCDNCGQKIDWGEEE